MVATALEALDYVLKGLQKENAGTIDAYDFNMLYNKSQLNWVRQRWAEAEMNQKRMEDLRVLIPPPLLIPNTGASTPGGEVFSLPFTQVPAVGVSRGYLGMLNCALKFADPTTLQPISCNWPGGYSPARPLRRDSRYDNLPDPYWRPTTLEPYYFLTGHQFRIECGGTAVAIEARIEYIRYPVEINLLTNPIINPELQPQAIQEVCDLAIQERLETIESRRFQTARIDQAQTPK